MNFFSLKILLELWLSLKIKQTCLDRSVLLKSTTSCAFILFSCLLLSFIQSQFYKKVLANFTSCKDLDCYFLNNIFFRNDFSYVYLYVRIILLISSQGNLQAFCLGFLLGNLEREEGCFCLFGSQLKQRTSDGVQIYGLPQWGIDTIVKKLSTDICQGNNSHKHLYQHIINALLMHSKNY